MFAPGHTGADWAPFSSRSAAPRLVRAPRISTPTHAPSTATREVAEFRHGQLVRWHVEELSCAGTPGARGERCLVFTSDFSMRRVWSYPADWRTLGDEALLRVSWGR